MVINALLFTNVITMKGKFTRACCSISLHALPKRSAEIFYTYNTHITPLHTVTPEKCY